MTIGQNKVYVGNLSYESTDKDLSDLFSKYGKIVDIKLITDRNTGRSKGFGFVTFENNDSAKSALEACNQIDFQGRKIRVNFARNGRRNFRNSNANSNYYSNYNKKRNVNYNNKNKENNTNIQNDNLKDNTK